MLKKANCIRNVYSLTLIIQQSTGNKYSSKFSP